MKKYLLPLILILALLFVSVGDCADLYGTYDQRIKLTTDNTKIDAALSNFPTTVFFTSTQGEEIFVEFDADTDYMKGAFTLSDGTTQLYAEKELFDDSAQKAIYHVKVTSIASGADTDIYFYYDNDAADNTTYIGTVDCKNYPPTQSATYVKVTTNDGNCYYPYFVTDPTKSLTGTSSTTSWRSAASAVTNQRFHIDLGSAKVINKIYYENFHISGSNTDIGVQNFTFWGSNTGAGTFDDLVYANDGGWTQLTISQSTFDQHTGSDVADPKYITVTNGTAYRYYAFKFADNYGNATYIGVRRIELRIDTDPHNVWDGNFKLVCHGADATTSTVQDSTSNNNYGEKKATNEPIEAAGKVHKGQQYDGSNDDIDCGTGANVNISGNITLEAITKFSTSQDNRPIISRWGSDHSYLLTVDYTNANRMRMSIRVSDTTKTAISTSTYNDDAWHYHVGRWNGSNVLLNVDSTAESITGDATAGPIDTPASIDLILGAYVNDPVSSVFEGIIDEVRISATSRTDAWIKATYNTLWDSLLTYHSEETSGAAEDNAVFFGMNF